MTLFNARSIYFIIWLKISEGQKKSGIPYFQAQIVFKKLKSV